MYYSSRAVEKMLFLPIFLIYSCKIHWYILDSKSMATNWGRGEYKMVANRKV